MISIKSVLHGFFLFSLGVLGLLLHLDQACAFSYDNSLLSVNPKSLSSWKKKSFCSTSNRVSITCKLLEEKQESLGTHIPRIPNIDKYLDPNSRLKIPNPMVYKHEVSWGKNLAQQVAFKKWPLFRPWKHIKYDSVLQIDLKGSLGLAGDSGTQQLCRALARAAHDPRIQAALVKFDLGFEMGGSDTQELRRHMDYFRQANKTLIGFSEIVVPKNLYLGSGCDELYVPPEAYLMLNGWSVPVNHRRGVLDKVGVEYSGERIGAYKSFGDTYSRYNASAETLEVLETLVQSTATHWKEQVAADRGRTYAEAEALIDAAPYSVGDLVDRGFVTQALYADEVKELMEERYGKAALFSNLKKKLGNLKKWGKPYDADDLSKEVTYIQVPDYLEKSGKNRGAVVGEPGRDGNVTVAVVCASGAIVNDALPKFPGSATITLRPFAKQLQKVEEDSDIDAVVLWIDSPGGDAVVSDYMWRKVQKLSKKKPIVACMGNVAASGGYYISMACDKIVCNPLTITGSIGVVGQGFKLKELLQKVGYTVERVSSGKFSEVLAGEKGFTPEEEEYQKKSIRATYDSFVAKAAASRGLSAEAMEAAAQGRVWTGQQALQLGLVDDLGGIRKAVDIAAGLYCERQNVTDPFVSKIKFEEPEVSFLEQVLKILSGTMGGESSASLNQIYLLKVILPALLDGDVSTVLKSLSGGGYTLNNGLLGGSTPGKHKYSNMYSSMLAQQSGVLDAVVTGQIPGNVLLNQPALLAMEESILNAISHL